MKVRDFLEMVHQAAVQLMLQLRGKDSPAVLWISPCAYVIRIHGTAVRPGASDPGMRWQEKRQRINTEDPESDGDSLNPAHTKQDLLFALGVKYNTLFWDTGHINTGLDYSRI